MGASPHTPTEAPPLDPLGDYLIFPPLEKILDPAEKAE